MHRLLLALALAFFVSVAGAQGSETDESPFAVQYLSGGQLYCKASLGYDPSGLCYIEHNLVDFQGLRLGVANRLDLYPQLRNTSMVLVDYVAYTWFAGAEFGRVIYGPGDWQIGAYFGLTIP